MREMGMYKIDTGASSFFLERLGTDDSVSEINLSNNLLYNLYSFAQESVHLEKNSSLKIPCVEQKITFPYIYYIKQ